KGNVVRKMFADVDGDVFVMIDADDTYDVKNINQMIDNLIQNDLDMLVARRKSVEQKAYRFGHKLGNILFSYLVKIIFGNQIDDLFSGFRVFTRRFVKSFPGNSNGFEIETELTIHALEQRLAVGEMDCDYKSRPSGSSSKLNTIQDGLKILRVILVLIKDERPLFFFSSFAVFFVFFSLILGIPIILNFMETGLVEKIPSAILAAVNMVIAFLSFFSGLILDVIKKSRHERKRLNYLMVKK
ncbi:glycosyltransferase, partial [Rickettsiales bacterium]|nr:glycosyltransferase [Rickettsiales bacterium]